MKNMFNKTNAPYLVIGALAIGTLLAVYIGYSGPAAALVVGLPFIIGGAVFSVVTIALSYAAISKNNTVSEKDAVVHAQEQRISELETRLAKKNTELFDQQTQLSREGDDLNYLDLAVPSSKQKPQANKKVDYLDLATSKNLNHLNVDISSLKSKSVENCNAKSGDEKDAKVSNQESQPTKEENGQGWTAWGKAKLVAGIAVAAGAVAFAAPYTPTILNGVVASSIDNSTFVDNGTCPCYS